MENYERIKRQLIRQDFDYINVNQVSSAFKKYLPNITELDRIEKLFSSTTYQGNLQLVSEQDINLAFFQRIAPSGHIGFLDSLFNTNNVGERSHDMTPLIPKSIEGALREFDQKINYGFRSERENAYRNRYLEIIGKIDSSQVFGTYLEFRFKPDRWRWEQNNGHDSEFARSICDCHKTTSIAIYDIGEVDAIIGKADANKIEVVALVPGQEVYDKPREAVMSIINRINRKESMLSLQDLFREV